MDIETLRNIVFTQKKNYGKVATEWGMRTWLDYYEQNFKDLRQPSSGVLDAIQHETESILGTSISKAARSSVEKRRWVSTADHHGLLMHPYFYGSTLAETHERTIVGQAHVVLPFGTVSLSNDSFPRGFFFHDAHGALTKFYFQSLKQRRMPVCVLAPFSYTEFARESTRILDMSLRGDVRERLATFVETVRADSRVWEQETYSAQLTLLNSIFWKLLFGDFRGELVYLDIESVVKHLLLQKHLVKETNIYRVLFDTKWRDEYLERFDGVTGAHHGETGAHFFWYVDYARHERVQLFVKGNSLVTLDSRVMYELTPEIIARALRARAIIPGTALIMLILTTEEGLSCAGGASQGDYLPDMVKRWRELVEDMCGTCADETQMNIIGGDYAFFDIESERRSLASLFDIFLYSDNPTQFVDDALQSSNIGDTINALLPEVFRYTTHGNLPMVSLDAPVHIRLPS